MHRLVRDEGGQSLMVVALFLAFVGVLLLAAIGVASAYSLVAKAQAAADAGVLAGAQQARVREIRIGGHTLCTIIEIDPSAAEQKAHEFWALNIGDTPIQTTEFRTTAYPGSRPTRLQLHAKVEAPVPLFSVLGRPRIGWTVMAEAALEQECENTLPGPVFTLSRNLPAGWPVEGAEWVWNFPAADRNAPVAWPVWFVTTFEMPKDGTVHVYAAADANYEIGIDADIVMQGDGPLVQEVTVPVASGEHLIWIKATNPAPASPFEGPNPSGIVVGITDETGNVLVATKGNALANAGKPSSKDNWGSWSPTNPDWTVYADPFYPTNFVQGGHALASLLETVGFGVRGAADLQSWMQSAINTGRAPRTIVVMAQDIAPDTIVESASTSALVRRYLDAGGSVLWMGDAPFYYRGHSDGSTTFTGAGDQERILGISDTGAQWNVLQPIQPTGEGQKLGVGIGPWWMSPVSRRAIPPQCWAEPLGTIANGGVAAWRVPYWPYGPDCNAGPAYTAKARSEDTPGFVRIFDNLINLSSPDVAVAALTVAGQMAGWYRGQ